MRKCSEDILVCQTLAINRIALSSYTSHPLTCRPPETLNGTGLSSEMQGQEHAQRCIPADGAFIASTLPLKTCCLGLQLQIIGADNCMDWLLLFVNCTDES